jgi:hypothetical protein
MPLRERYARFLPGKLLAKRKKSIKIFNFARFGRFDTILDVEFQRKRHIVAWLFYKKLHIRRRREKSYDH